MAVATGLSTIDTKLVPPIDDVMMIDTGTKDTNQIHDATVTNHINDVTVVNKIHDVTDTNKSQDEARPVTGDTTASIKSDYVPLDPKDR